MVFPSRKKVIFVHGCFWHQHRSADCRIARTPKSNVDYWTAKLARNRQRDEIHVAELRQLGWESKAVWECEIRLDVGRVRDSLRRFLN